MEEEEGGSKLASALAYPKLLIDNRLYRAAFFASIFQDLGAWANLIASRVSVSQSATFCGLALRD